MERRPEESEMIAKRLDREMKALKNWRHFSNKLNVDFSVIERHKWYGDFSPTIQVFGNLEIVQPDLTIAEVKNALCNIGRNDLSNKLDTGNCLKCITYIIIDIDIYIFGKK